MVGYGTRGFSPYLHTPWMHATYYGISSYGQACVGGMNSAHYMTVYPLVCQAVFFLSSWENLGIAGSVTLMRVFHIIIEIGVGYLMGRMLQQQGKPLWLMAGYFWNPLVVMEGVGNVHFEPYIVLFLLLSLASLRRWEAVGSAFFSFSCDRGKVMACDISPLRLFLFLEALFEACDKIFSLFSVIFRAFFPSSLDVDGSAVHGRDWVIFTEL